MPITDNPNETSVFNYLVSTAGFNTAVACGILTNIYFESSFNTRAVGDNGTSIGLCQWHNTRATDLKNYCSKKGYDLYSVEGQMSFLMYELRNKTSSLFSELKSCSNDANGARQSAYRFCKVFEVPANTETVSNNRGDYAKKTVYPMYSKTKTVNGDNIVTTARGKFGCKYASSSVGYGPDTFSSYGLVYYCYKENGVDIPKTVEEQAKLTGVRNIQNNFKAGDILFFNGENRKESDTLVFSAIATGSGSNFIGCMGWGSYNKVMLMTLDPEPVEEGSDDPERYIWKEKFVGGIRILNDGSGVDSSTYSGYTSTSGTYGSLSSSIEDIKLSNSDSYAENLTSALSVIEESGDSYCSLISLRDGEEFKFYVGTGVSENFPVSYSSPGNVIGRSVPIIGYDSTGARTVAISLDLFAGEKYRPDIDTTDSDPIGTLHKDLDKLKSFEYPDYSSAIVIPPPIVLLSIGSVKIRGVLQGLSIEYSRPYDSKNRAMHATVSFTVTQVSENPPDYLDIRNRTSKSY